MKHRRSAKELLVHFLKARAKLIAKHSEIEYLNSLDYNEILGWSEEQCVEVLCHVVDYVARCGINDRSTCLWCAYQKIEQLQTGRFGSYCLTCTYGFRHKCCKEYDSDYRRILLEAFSEEDSVIIRCITQIPKMEKLCLHYIELFKKFLKGLEETV